MCTYHFLKKKNVEWNCGNGIAEIGWKKKLQLVCGNPIAENGKEKKSGFRNLGRNLKKKSYVHNIFTTFSQKIIGD